MRSGLTSYLFRCTTTRPRTPWSGSTVPRANHEQSRRRFAGFGSRRGNPSPQGAQLVVQRGSEPDRSPISRRWVAERRTQSLITFEDPPLPGRRTFDLRAGRIGKV